jgi:hypothetical protein
MSRRTASCVAILPLMPASTPSLGRRMASQIAQIRTPAIFW